MPYLSNITTRTTKLFENERLVIDWLVFSLSPVSKVLHVIRRIYENKNKKWYAYCIYLWMQHLFHIHNSVFCNIHTLHFSTTFLFSFDWFLFPEVSCKWRETSFPFVPFQLLLSVYVAFGLLVISLTSCCRKIVARLRQVFRAV